MEERFQQKTGSLKGPWQGQSHGRGGAMAGRGYEGRGHDRGGAMVGAEPLCVKMPF